jgi:very-short-patch-repair endonuclease
MSAVDGGAHDQSMMRRVDAVRDAVLARTGEVVLRYRARDIHATYGRTASQIAAWLDLRH